VAASPVKNIIEIWKLIAEEALSNVVISTKVVKKLCFTYHKEFERERERERNDP
jgi:hypothetical protein